MAKYKLITRSLDPRPEKFELFEEVIEADNVMLDQTGYWMLFCEASRLEPAMAPSPGGPIPMSIKIIKWVNKDCIVECFDVQKLSRMFSA